MYYFWHAIFVAEIQRKKFIIKRTEIFMEKKSYSIFRNGQLVSTNYPVLVSGHLIIPNP